jgi:hypothetical protein
MDTKRLTILGTELPDTNSHPHLTTVQEAWIVNGIYKVMISKTLDVKHVRIRRLDDRPVTEYSIFQQIKNHFLGREVVAVQVFPKMSDYIDNSNTYHLFSWDGIDVPNLKTMYKYNK